MASNAFDEYRDEREGWKTREWARENEAWRGQEHLSEEWDEELLFDRGQLPSPPSHEQQAALQQLAEAAASQVAQMLELRREIMREVHSLRRQLSRLKANRDAVLGNPQDAPAWFEEAESQLERVWLLSSKSNWNDEGAEPLSANVITHARKLLKLFPSYVPQPFISADSDGYLAFDWDWGGDEVFSISVDDSGTLHFAGLFGPNRNHGAEKLENGLPEMVVANLERFLRKNP